MTNWGRDIIGSLTNQTEVSNAISSIVSSAINATIITDGISTGGTEIPLPTSVNSTSLITEGLTTELPITSSPVSEHPNTTTISNTTEATPQTTDTPNNTANLSNFAIPTSSATLTTFVTSLSNGVPTTVTSQLPTSLVPPSPSRADPHLPAIIGGSIAAVIAFIIIILVAVFGHRRHRNQRRLSALGMRREGRHLLEGDGFDDDHNGTMSQTNSHRHSLSRPTSPSPSLLKSRTTRTGSIFREEVSSPPGFVDPISKNNSSVDLSIIVDNIMGPSGSGHGNRDPSNATTSSVISSATTTSLLPGDWDDPLSTSHRPGDSIDICSDNQGFMYATSPSLPPGASLPRQPGMVSFSSSAALSTVGSDSHSSLASSTSSSASVSTLAAPRPLSVSTLPKKSSPLARALTQDEKILTGSGLVPQGPKFA